jgi:hypothetical protein
VGSEEGAKCGAISKRGGVVGAAGARGGGGDGDARSGSLKGWARLSVRGGDGAG